MIDCKLYMETIVAQRCMMNGLVSSGYCVWYQHVWCRRAVQKAFQHVESAFRFSPSGNLGNNSDFRIAIERNDSGFETNHIKGGIGEANGTWSSVISISYMLR